jgi:hypothetical protein
VGLSARALAKVGFRCLGGVGFVKQARLCRGVGKAVDRDVKEHWNITRTLRQSQGWNGRLFGGFRACRRSANGKKCIDEDSVFGVPRFAGGA